eukprot:m.138948 g.138948  ORF g.138948 m.138948 type:complete len:64 (+) comp22745_c0_seq1:1110-1301(+)
MNYHDSKVEELPTFEGFRIQRPTNVSCRVSRTALEQSLVAFWKRRHSGYSGAMRTASIAPDVL